MTDPRDVQGGEFALVAYTGEDVTVYALPAKGSAAIGRADDCDIQIRDSSVSRRHCLLHIGPPLQLEDLGGPNGTAVRDRCDPLPSNETRSPQNVSGETVDIHLGDKITIGSTMLVIRRAAREKTPNGDAANGCDVVLRDPGMRALYDQAKRAAQAMISVLILGETGVGKEVLARSIHEQSPRAKSRFLGLNCAALSESLLESELFGHEKGAFTGALQARPGLFESAEGGTVFLDEVGELPTSIQVKLLRVIEERVVMRVGGRNARPIDVRFIAATNRELETEIARGAFRQDLFFRLNGFTLLIPPLRDRAMEIEPLAKMFAEAACKQLDRPEVPEASAELLAALHGYPWPGNVRELRNVIERAVVVCPGSVLLPDHLPSKFFAAHKGPPSSSEPVSQPSSSKHGIEAPPSPGTARLGAKHEELHAELESLERQRLVSALEEAAGNQKRAAEILGISRRTLVTRLGEYGLPRPRKKAP